MAGSNARHNKRGKKSAKSTKELVKAYIDDEAIESDGEDDEMTAGTLTPTEEELADRDLSSGDEAKVASCQKKGKSKAVETDVESDEKSSPVKIARGANDADVGAAAERTDVSAGSNVDGIVAGFNKKVVLADKVTSPLEGAAFREFRAALKEPSTKDAFIAAAVAASLKDASTNTSIEPDNGQPVHSVGGLPEVSNQAETVFLEDLEDAPLAIPTDGCGVNDPALQDPLLKSQYAGLPFLPGECEIYGWSTAPSTISGWTQFSMWGEQNPNLNVQLAMDSMQFVRSGRFINPSRVAPLHLSTRPVYPGSDSRRLHVSGGPAICVSAIFSVDSFLVYGKEGNLHQKLISGIFHSQEWQRFEALMCLAFGHRHLKAQYRNHAIDFCSRAMPKGKLATEIIVILTPRAPFRPNDDADASKLNAPMGMFGGASSSKKGSHPTHGQYKGFKPVLDFDEKVPAYDARAVPFKVDSDLGALDSKLPPFDGEVPPGSFVVVGYTVSVYLNKGIPTLSCSIQWVIVVGTPA